MTSTVMTGEDPNLSLTATVTPMEVTDNVASSEDAEVAVAAATLQQLITNEPPEGSDGHQHTYPTPSRISPKRDDISNQKCIQRTV
ncbi:MAG: hypothetical protein GY702_25760 [Desulfobulbaceae bacterium]|nr:hypothetical protein [Desulfobulbaceae bacterium]